MMQVWADYLDSLKDNTELSICNLITNDQKLVLRGNIMSEILNKLKKSIIN